MSVFLHALAIVVGLGLAVVEPRVWFVVAPLCGAYLLLAAASRQEQNEKP